MSDSYHFESAHQPTTGCDTLSQIEDTNSRESTFSLGGVSEQASIFEDNGLLSDCMSSEGNQIQFRHRDSAAAMTSVDAQTLITAAPTDVSGHSIPDASTNITASDLQRGRCNSKFALIAQLQTLLVQAFLKLDREQVKLFPIKPEDVKPDPVIIQKLQDAQDWDSIIQIYESKLSVSFG